MKQKPLVLLLLAGIALTTLFTNCASLTGYQTGRTVGEGNGEISFSLNASQTPKFDFGDNDTFEINDQFFFPNLELGGRYGVAEKVDLGIRMNTNLNIFFDAKFQVVGDQESPFALALGGGVGNFGFILPLWNVQVPLYLSVHPSDNLDIYFTPRYINQFAAGTIDKGLSYLGGNAGVLFGRRTKFGLDAGYYSVGFGDERVVLNSFGIGVKVPLSGNSDDDRRGR